MSFPRYPRYKDSGVAWLGEVPEHWEVRPLKYLVRLSSGGTPSKARADYWDGDVPWASSKDLKVDALADTEDHITRMALADGAVGLVAAGSLMVVVRGMILAHSFPVTKALVPMAINQDLKAVVPVESLNGDFLAWLLRGSKKETLSRLDEAAHGTKALRMDAWTSMELPVPAPEEQQAIASFLDRETAKIDALVAEQRRLVELLKEKRQAVISHAVTKGLDPSVPMKDSGVAWLGEVPAHWELLPVKRLASLRSGESITSDDIEEEGTYPVFGGNGRRGFTESFTHEGRFALIGRQGALCGNVNYATGRFWASEHAVVANPVRAIEVVWLGEMLRAMNLNQYSTSAAQPGLSVEVVGNLRTPAPPLAEQTAIATFLDGETAKLDTLIAEATKAISLLLERRTALISAAVTGKIDVREHA